MFLSRCFRRTVLFVHASLLLFFTGITLMSAETADDWKQVELFVQRQQPKSALEALLPLEAKALKLQDFPEIARSIATRAILETADRPPDDGERLRMLTAAIKNAPAQTVPVLDAIGANWTWNFFLVNRWRYAQRSTGGSAADAPIETWELSRIISDIDQRMTSAVAAKEFLSKLPVDTWSTLINKGTLGDSYRPTVWDVVVRDAIAFYSSGERGLIDPEDVFEISVDSAVLGNVEEFLQWKPESTDLQSPELKAFSLFQKLLAFHRNDKDQTAFLSADFDRIEYASQKAVGEHRIDRHIEALSEFIADAKANEVSSMARARLAELLQSQDDVLQAHAVAKAGEEAYPTSVGGIKCRNLVRSIESKELSVVTERLWAKPWPSMRITYKNLEKVHVRIVPAAWRDRMKKGGQIDAGWLEPEDRAAALALRPVREISVDCPATPDFRQRHHDVPVPKDLPPGAYYVIASHDAAFGEQNNVVSFTEVWVTQLAVVVRPHSATDVGLSGHVVFARSGEPVAGASVQAFSRKFQDNAMTLVESQKVKSDAQGRFVLKSEGQDLHVVVAESVIDGTTHAAASQPLWIGQSHPIERQQRSLVVTDRAIYRPGQTIHYKAIAYHFHSAPGKPQQYGVLPEHAVTLVLRDVNSQEIARTTHTTNAFGSCAGTFTAPSRTLLGAMTIVAETDAPGVTAIRVEEYKRPKFKVEIDSPQVPVVLEGQVTLTGKATTYTGIPVVGATVNIRVVRQVRFPPWCRFWFGLPPGGEEASIARGRTVSDATGSFQISFPAKPDRSVSRESLPVFSYRISADVIDSSGETRAATKTISAGYSPIEATIEIDSWQTTDAPSTFRISTRSLDGIGQKIKGRLAVYRLVQPAEVIREDLLRGAFQPINRRGRAGVHKVAAIGPGMVPVVDPSDSQSWEIGEVIFTRDVETDNNGFATVQNQLSGGIYRAIYTLHKADEKDVKAVAEMVLAKTDVEVIDPVAEQYAVKRAMHVASPQWSVEPGNVFSMTLGSGYDSARPLVEISCNGQLLLREWMPAGKTQWTLTQKIREEHRGGMTVNVWLVRDGRLHAFTRVVDVPWSNKSLLVKWERFTRLLEPGAKEVWRATITGPDSMGAASEMVATLYDQSLDALSKHEWPLGGFNAMGIFRFESSQPEPVFSNNTQRLNPIVGSWLVDFKQIDATYREFKQDFAPPTHGGFLQGRMFKGPGAGAGGLGVRFSMMRGGDAMADADNVTSLESAASSNSNRVEKLNSGNDNTPLSDATAAIDLMPPRRSLAETAFFLPSLVSNKDGSVSIEFELPDTLTTWAFQALVHDSTLRSGTLTDTMVTAKDLMVEPVVPRFVREGDKVFLPVKVTNRSSGRLSGKVRISLSNARTGELDQDIVQGDAEQSFDLAAGESKPIFFSLVIHDGADVLLYRAIGVAGKTSDGEEGFLPVLPRRVLVSENIQLFLRGKGDKSFELPHLLESAKKPSIRQESLTVQIASNPAWYAVLAMPSLMETHDESTEATFSRLYANSLARHIVTGDKRIARVFEQWKGTKTLTSPLEKNAELMRTLIAETPWVLDAVNEKESRARIALLFDATRAANETASAMAHLVSQRLPDGSWPWFPGGTSCDSVTLSILSGCGRLRKMGVDIDLQMATGSLEWLDGKLIAWHREAKQQLSQQTNKQLKPFTISSTVALALYARTFFFVDKPLQGEALEAFGFWIEIANSSWPNLLSRMSQGHIALAAKRFEKLELAAEVVKSLRERSVQEEEVGMWWRDPHPAWGWSDAPIETQSLMVEVFDEIAGDAAAVESLKQWLLSQKRTSHWRGSRATADAIYALLRHGSDLLASTAIVELAIGGVPIVPDGVEAGTGFYEIRKTRSEIKPTDGNVQISKKDDSAAWGGVHWQYFDDLSNVSISTQKELTIEKRLFTKRNTKAGPILEAVTGPLTVGDEVVVRLIVTSDRDYEFLELSDHRACVCEPVDVLSGWRQGDGVAWYAATRDTKTDFFFERLPRGTHLFEYSVRVSHRGTASSGFASIQSRYAPEFSAHSESIAVEVK